MFTFYIWASIGLSDLLKWFMNLLYKKIFYQLHPDKKVKIVYGLTAEKIRWYEIAYLEGRRVRYKVWAENGVNHLILCDPVTFMYIVDKHVLSVWLYSYIVYLFALFVFVIHASCEDCEIASLLHAGRDRV